MRRDIISILVITAIVVTATLLIGPLSRQKLAPGYRVSDSIPIEADGRGPLAEPSRRPSGNAAPIDIRENLNPPLVTVRGQVIDEEWGVGAPAYVGLCWSTYGRNQYSDFRATQDDGTFHNNFELLFVNYQVVVCNSPDFPERGVKSRIYGGDESDIDVGELRIATTRKPRLLTFKGSKSVGYERALEVWKIEGDTRQMIARGHQTFPPGKYVLRLIAGDRAWYKEIDCSKGPVEIEAGYPDRSAAAASTIVAKIGGSPNVGILNGDIKIERKDPFEFWTVTRAGRVFDSPGTLTCGPLPAGTYRVTVSYPSPYVAGRLVGELPVPFELVLGTGEKSTFHFEPFRYGDIHARVTRRGQPVPNYELAMYQDIAYSGRPEWKTATTDEAGLAHFGAMEWMAGVFLVQNNWKREHIVTAGQTDTNVIWIELEPEGTVRLSGRLQAVPPSEFEGRPVIGLESKSGDLPIRLDCDDDNGFDISGVPTGTYVMEVGWRSSTHVKQPLNKSIYTLDLSEPGRVERVFEIGFGAFSAGFEELAGVDWAQSTAYVKSLDDPNAEWRVMLPAGGVLESGRVPAGRYLIALMNLRRIRAYAEIEIRNVEKTEVEWNELLNPKDWPKHFPEPPERR